jgi:hypothetical protein
MNMNVELFRATLEHCIEYNPLRSFARNLYDAGVTEEQLQQLLDSCPLVGDPDKVRLQNYYRDVARVRPTKKKGKQKE